MSIEHRSAGDWVYLTACADPEAAGAEQAQRLYQEIFQALGQSSAQIVQERIYGRLSAREVVLRQRQEAAQAAEAGQLVPPTYIEGAPCEGEGLAGVHMVAVAPGTADQPTTVEDVRSEGRCSGRRVRRLGAEFFYSADVAACACERAAGASRTDQAWAAYEAAAELLRAQELSFADVVRTWVYLDDILSWYDEFNQVRNDFYSRAGLLGQQTPGFLPASTGIEGSNPWALSCALDVLAVRPTAAAYPRVSALSNPRQSEAYEYGSSFSRGACLAETDVTHIYVSGTAAIDEAGQSVCHEDLDGQVEYTVRNVESLLAQAKATLADICQATVFFKQDTDPTALARAFERTGLASFPAVTVRADICRQELLFEMDAAATVPTRGS